VAEKIYMAACTNSRSPANQGSGGNGAKGIIQLQVPRGSQASVDPSAKLTRAAWVDKNNGKNPSPFSDTSVAQSRWLDLGRVIDRGLPGTRPVFAFLGTDANGFVRTDAAGNVLDAGAIDLRCDFLGVPDPFQPGGYLPGLAPRADFVPPNTSVKVEYQGADAMAPGSKDVDPNTLTSWSPDPAVADGRQFLRWRVVFDLSVDDTAIGPSTPRPSLQWFGPRATY